MKFTTYTSIFLSASAVCIGQVVVSPNLTRLLDVPLKDLSTSALTDGDRLQLIADLKRAKSDFTFREAHGARPDLLLIELGDRETIAKYYEENFTTYGTKSLRALMFLSQMHQPLLIEKFSKALLTEEEAKMIWITAERLYPAQSVAAADLIQSIVLRSPVFSEEAKRWASSIPDKPLGAKREAVRRFWTANEARFRAERFGEVVPPAAEVRVDSSPSGVSLTPELPAIARPPTKRPRTNASSSTTAPTQATSPAASAPVVPSASASPVPLWPWVLLVGGIFAGSLWWRSR